MKHIYKLLILTTVFLLSANVIFAQVPANDDCSNADSNWKNGDGTVWTSYQIGTITSNTTDITNATKVLGEPIHNVHMSGGTDKKTVWYKFHLPTSRSVRVTLEQIMPDNTIEQSGAGFTVFKSGNCMPSLDDVEAAKLTPVNQFGNSYNPCLGGGDYLIQISAKDNASGIIFLTMELGQPQILNSYDKFTSTDVYNMGTISNGWYSVEYDVGCLTIDDATEVCSNVLGADYLSFTQSSWHIFTTDSHVDAIRMAFGETQTRFEQAGYTWANYPVFGMKIYEGDARSTPIASLTEIEGCTKYQQTSSTVMPNKNFRCLFEPNKTYSIQFFFKENYMQTFSFNLYELGAAPTNAPSPVIAATLPTAGSTNNMGILPSSVAGTWTSRNDWFACNSYMIDNVCDPVNPVSGSIGGRKLSTWYRFELAEASNVIINTSGYTVKRLYRKGADESCGNLVFEQEFSGNKTINCMNQGVHYIQLLGNVWESETSDYILNENYSQLGRPANIQISVQTVEQENVFSLKQNTGRVDKLNVVSGIQEGLPPTVKITGTTDRFACVATVMPNVKCGSTDRAIYRTLKIDDYGTIEIGGGNYYFDYGFYFGDAEALANTQNMHNAGQTFTGLTRIACFNFGWGNSGVYTYCVQPGTYTLISFGDVNDVGLSDAPWVKFKSEVLTLFKDPASPNNMGNITASISGGVSGTVSYWSCYNNPLTIDGKAPCSGSTKQIYREFYIDQPKYLRITSGNYARLFAGKISDGVGTLSANIPGYGDYGCFPYSWYYGYYFQTNTGPCSPVPLQPGWYTVVSYAGGGIYSGTDYAANLGANNISIQQLSLQTIPGPQFNAPNLASDEGVVDWRPNFGTSAYPLTYKYYNFQREYYNCNNDLPFPVETNVCGNPGEFNRETYYVFELARESFVSIIGITGSHKAVLHNLDIRTDMASFATDVPIQPCIQTTTFSDYGGGGRIDVCKMQPGVYTLIIYSNDSHIGQSLSPTIYVEKIEDSRFDHAKNAYDFDDVPGDAVWHTGKVGDVNPLDAGRAASNDFMSCTTGAQTSDPMVPVDEYCFCGYFPNNPIADPDELTSIPYPMTDNYNIYSALTGNRSTLTVRRNLWYTFTVTGPGRVTIQVNDKTNRPGLSTIQNQSPWILMRSKNDILLDSIYGSTATASLEYMNHSSLYDWYHNCIGNTNTLNFYIEPCDAPTTRRYYVLVDNSTYGRTNYNNQVEISIKFEPETALSVKYDNYSDVGTDGANRINGLGETTAPYTDVSLTGGTYTGAQGSFPCATSEPFDQNTLGSPAVACGTTTIWYCFDVAVAGKLRINYDLLDGTTTTTHYDPQNMVLMRELIADDPTPGTGLLKLSPTALTDAGVPWGETCLTPGRYYIMFTGCSYNFQKVTPRVKVIDVGGDLCSNPASLPDLTAPGSTNVSTTINCHSIGEAFGEDGSNMGCLFGPTGYKSTWFKVYVDITSTKVDLSFKLAENTSVLPNKIRYRVMYGSCEAMSAGPCNTDALTEFTLNCMKTDGIDYYVQVITPEYATGDLIMTVTAEAASDQDCIPFDPLEPVANFTVDGFCIGEQTDFTNYSTQGETIDYLWTITDRPGGSTIFTSTLFNPSLTFPAVSEETYDVKLEVTNTYYSPALMSWVSIPVTISPITTGTITREAPFESPTIITTGADVTFHLSPDNEQAGTTYQWTLSGGNFGTTKDPNPVQYGQPDIGTHEIYVDIANNACINRETHTINIGSESIFTGGPYDGASLVSTGELNCPVELIFYGGPYDGTDIATTGDIDCSDVFELIYYGGPYDGTDIATTGDIDCSDVFELIYYGGPHDGTDLNTTGEVDCPEELVFYGGPYDGTDMGIFGEAKINDGKAVINICIDEPVTLASNSLTSTWYEDNAGAWTQISTDQIITLTTFSTAGQYEYKLVVPAACNEISVPVTPIMEYLPDASITGAACCGAGHESYQGRLYDNDAASNWSAAANDINQWLKVDCGEVKEIVKFATQGRHNNPTEYNQWVLSYKISYSDDNVTWSYYGAGGTPEALLADAFVFGGNSDANSVVSHDLIPSVNARYFRIHPVTYNNHTTMRLEIYEPKESADFIAYVTVDAKDVLANVKIDDSNLCYTVDADKQFFTITGIPDETLYTLEYEWDFGDGTTGVGKNPHHTYTTPGTKTATLTVRIPGACETTVTQDFTGQTIPALTSTVICKGDNVDMTAGITGSCYTPDVPFSAIMPALANGNITASSNYAGLPCTNGRLNNSTTTGWSAATNDANQWMQIDCGAVKTITRVATQGRWDANQWVTTYKISYSTDNITWLYYGGSSLASATVLSANSNRDTVVYHDLSPKITAQYLRIHPVSWNGHISMRMEIYEGGYDSWNWYVVGNSTSLSTNSTYSVSPIVNTNYKVVTLNQCCQPIEQNFTVTIKDVTGVNFTSSPACVLVGTEVSFTETTGLPAVTPYNFSWTFGDTGTSTDRNPKHTYTGTGSYTVRLTIDNAGDCPDYIEKTIQVDPVTSYFAYRTKQNGNWTDLNTWQVYDTGTSTWIDATSITSCSPISYPTSAHSTILVQHDVTYNTTIAVGIDETTISAAGTLTIPAGIDLKMVDVSSSPIAADIQNNGRLNIAGTFTKVGTALLVNIPTSVVAYTATGNQTMWDGEYGKLEIAGNAGAEKTVSGNNTRVVTDLKFVNNSTFVKLNSKNLYLNQTATITNYDCDNFIITNSWGSVVRENLGLLGNEQFEYPIGSAQNSYNKAIVLNAGTSDNIFVRVGGLFSYDSNFTDDELIQSSSVNRTWFLNETVAGGSDITLNVYWQTADENGSFDRANSHIGAYNDATGWERFSANDAATGAGSCADMYTRYATGIADLNAFAVGSCMFEPLSYRTITAGNWTDVSIWEVWDAVNSAWVATTMIPSACGAVPYPSSYSLDIDVRHNVNYDYSIPQGVDELTIESGATLTIPSGNTFILVDGAGTDMINKGNVTVTGDITRNGSSSTLDNQTSSIFLYNGAAQTILDCTYSILKVQGGLANAGTVKTLLSNNTRVNNQFEFINAKVNLNFDITIGEDAVITNPSQNNGYFVATANGFLIREFKTGISSAKIFPVGGVYYSPANLTFSNETVAGTMKAKVQETYHPNLSINGIKRYWTFEQGTAGFSGNYNLDLTYSVNDLASIPATLAEEQVMVEYAGAFNTGYTNDNWYFSDVAEIGYTALTGIHTGTITHNDFDSPTVDFTLTSSTVICEPFYNIDLAVTVCIGSDYTYPDGYKIFNVSANQPVYSCNPKTIAGCDSIINTTVNVYNPATSNYALYGEKQIYPGSVNYPNFQSAIDSLMLYGIKTSVTFRTVNTTYNEQLKIGKICGATGASKVLFTSICDDCERPLIQYNSDSGTDNYNLQFDFTENVTFKRIDFEAKGTTNARIVDIISCNKIEFDDCRFTGYKSTTATDDQRSLIYYSGNTTIGGMTFKNSIFRYGSYAIQIENPAVDMVNIFIDDNQFSNQSAGYLKLSKNKAPKIRRNVMNSSSTINNFAGISLSLITDKLVIESNEVYSFADGKALEIDNVDLCFCLDAIIANNMFGIGSGSNKTSYGMDIFNGSSNLNVYNNSVNVNSSAGAALKIDGLNNGDLINNIFVSGSATSADIANYTSSTEVYNDFFPDYAGKDVTSVSINPNYEAPDDLHTKEISLQMSTATCVNYDIDNEPRQATFYLGADEFLGEVMWEGTISTDWNNPANWNPAVVPTRGTTVNIQNASQPNFPETNGNTTNNLAEVRDITIQAGAHLYIAPKNYLTVYGTFMNYGEFVIKSDATGTGSFIPKKFPGTILGTGTSRVEQYLSMNKWHYVSSPVKDASGIYNGFYYWWDENVKDRWLENEFVDWNDGHTPNGIMGWTLASGQMEITKGYAFLGPTNKTVVATGELNSGTYTANLVFKDQGGSSIQDMYDGWNLLGNPYPSSINWNSDGIEMTNVDNAIYVYNDAGNARFDNYDYYMRGATNSPYPLIALNASSDSCHIAPNQSVMVKTNAVGAKVVITNEARRHRQTTFFKSKNEHPDLLIIAIANDKLKDETAIRFIPNTTEGYDGEYDAVKRYPAAGNVPQLSCETPVCDMAINTLPEIKDGLIIPLHLRINEQGKYTFSVREYNFGQGVSAFLIDKEANSRTELSKTSDYSVKLKTGRFDDRFYIIFKKEINKEEEPIVEILDIQEIADENVEIFSFKEMITVKLLSVKENDNYLMIYDVLGKKIVSKRITSDKTEIPMNTFAGGNYLVKVITKNKIYEQKVYIE